ncbi:Rha family transcriptional regulator [Clostridium botulinum]|uniref:Rha family transcriptional regulator n=1 Tax=Clostridium botulinum TaxID=1491 RepID=UPI0004D53D75|nr:Rha family transcriptional regulator [Clostridium botulinum]KEH99874.1 putative phage regulatory protein, Rha family [Clostridium botulinum C/D str. BKT75002]KEI05353.1 putative phage regulatory protein, Rha family [Clostridium botulinum C/D str. BKT2873]QPW62040.1 Rha family transcriptional regulator [Clostridium botulinum]
MKINKNNTSLEMEEMIATQLHSWELELHRKNLVQSTIDRKIKNITDFYIHLMQLRKNHNKITKDTINQIAFEYVRDGYFSEDNIDNTGSYGYRRNIFYNIKEGFNYIYEGMFNKKEVIKELNDNQKEHLDTISQNKFFRVTGVKDDKQTLQTKLIEELGIKVYFDKDNLPYVYSHELAENLNIQNKHIREKLKKINKDLTNRSFDPFMKHSNFNILEDTYQDSKGERRPTYKMYKDYLILYLMDTTAQGSKRLDILEFKMKYIDAFNYIEHEYNRLLKEYANLKDSFLTMFNDIRKRNRDLLITEHNKKAMKRKAS